MFKKGFYEKIGYEKFKQYDNYRQTYKSQASVSQISFLLGLISNYKFSNNQKIENVLEIGIYNGVTSLYMLKEGCKNPNYKQYGIDIQDGDFFAEAVFKEANSSELKHYTCCKKSTALDIPKIFDKNQKIDLAFIDGGHSHPLPLIDLVSIIPYLSNEAIVCLHDVINYMRPNAWGESFIYEAWESDKYRNIDILNYIDKEETLGVIQIPNEKELLYKLLLKISRLPFRASPWFGDRQYIGIDNKTIDKLEENMLTFYDENFTKEFINNFRTNLENYEQEWILRTHETRFYNYLFENVERLKAEQKKLTEKINFLMKTNPEKNLTTILENSSKKILFWGNSNFLNNYLNTNKTTNNNIIGIIDKNPRNTNNYYKIFSPNEIKDLKADLIIPTIYNNHKAEYKEIKDYIHKNYRNIEVSNDIFE